MRIASVNEIKQELNSLKPGEVKELCLRLARFKKENKELLSYLLFEAHDEQSYIDGVKEEINEAFQELPKSNLHLTKKSLRKVLRAISKYGRHIGTPQSQAEMMIHFCLKVNQSAIPVHKSPALQNLYQQQIKKITKLLDSIHEDLRYDYMRQLKGLEQPEKKRWTAGMVKKTLRSYIDKEILKSLHLTPGVTAFFVLLSLTKKKEVFMQSTDITWTPSVTF